eukprot:4465013-Prorocentrum_lima.AAC.1
MGSIPQEVNSQTLKQTDLDEPKQHVRLLCQLHAHTTQPGRGPFFSVITAKICGSGCYSAVRNGIGRQRKQLCMHRL